MKLGKCLEIMKVLLSLLVLFTNMLLVFCQRYKPSLKKQKQLQPQPITTDSCEKKYSKNLNQILEKKLWRSSFLVTLQARHLQIYQQINSSTVFFKENITCFKLLVISQNSKNSKFPEYLSVIASENSIFFISMQLNKCLF